MDLSKVIWVRSGDEHVASYQPPSNVVEMDAGATLEELLISGDLDAAIGIDTKHPDLAPMIAEPFEAAVTAMKTRGLYPINRLMVIRDATLAKNPQLGRAVFDAFSASKKIYVDKLKRSEIEELTKADRVHLSALEVMDDLLPYGIEPSRAVLEQLINHAVTQNIIPEKVSVESLFDPETIGLIG